MKKKTLHNALMGIIFGTLIYVPSAFASITFTPSTPTYRGTPSDTVNITCSVGDYLTQYSPVQDSMNTFACPFELNMIIGEMYDAGIGEYTFTECDSSVPDSECTFTRSYSDRAIDPGYISEATHSWTDVYTPPAEPSPDIFSFISNASTTFSSAVGFEWSEVSVFMNTLLVLIIGSSLGFLETLLPYIIGLLIIGAIVLLIYRSFRFLKH